MIAEPTRVVAIGGSAGALDALHRLFAVGRLPRRFAYVVLIHLGADRASALHELIAGWSGMPARMAEEGTRLEPGQVTVAPPGHHLVLDHGALRVLARPAADGRPGLIDRFLESLAAAADAGTTAVILSGTGSDGAAGAAAIKGAGGQVLAQDPATCSQSGMPSAVIRAGLADAVLPPEALACAIGDDARPRAAAPEPEPEPEPAAEDSGDEVFGAILGLVREHSGNDMSGYKPSTLRRRIDRRAALNHCADPARYLELLRGSPAEVDRLAKDMFVGVTAFLRDPEAFRVIETEVIPALARAKPPGEAIRVWAAGCSTGEEVYSLAMLFQEWFASQDAPARVQIFATDIDEAALEVARVGRYGDEALRSLPAGWRSRYFVDSAEGPTIAKSVRETVVFAAHNLISDPPFSRLDLLMCRNVLIYLNAETQRKLLGLFDFVVRPGGYLFLGSSESVGAMTEQFEPVSKQWRIFRHMGSGAARRAPPPLLVTGSSAARRQFAAGDIAADIGSLAGQERIYRRLIETSGPTLILLDARLQILYVSGEAAPYLDFPRGEPTQDLFKVVRPELRVALRSVVSRAQRERAKVAAITTRAAREGDGQAQTLRLTATPVSTPAEEPLLLVALETDVPARTDFASPGTEGEDWLLRQMEQELDATREDLQRTIERMRAINEETRATNEEITAMNEELQSSNEELESSKEELQSLNEELATANTTLDAKVVELERTNSDLNNLLVSAETATLFLDQDLRIRRFTAACTRLMRVIPADIGRSLADIVQLVGDHDLIEACLAVVAGRSVPDRELASADGRWYLRRILPYRTAEGAPNGVVLTFPDITAVKEGEAELARRNEQLEWQAELLREAPVLARDMDDRIVYWNPGAQALYGWTADEALRRVSHELLKSRFEVPIEQIKARVLAQGSWQGRITHTRRDGREITVDSHWALRRDHAGVPVAIVEVNNDVSARVLAEAELEQYRNHLEEEVRRRTEQLEEARSVAEQANRAKGEFLSHMSHELRTPLNAVLGFAHALAASEPSALRAEQREQVARIASAGEHLLHLLNDVLDLSRVDSGDLVIEPRPVRVAEAVAAAIESMAVPAVARKVAITHEMPDPSLGALCDPVRLHEVLLNLLSNAVKYNVEGGRVVVRAREAAAGGDGRRLVAIEVEDTGRGMTAVQLAQLFQPFNRLGAERSAVEGTGIGLAIAKRLVERMQGRIEVSSTVGRGSLFRVVLPAAGSVQPEARVTALGPPAEDGAAAGRDGRPLAVLYVEDHPVNVEVLRALVAGRSDLHLRVAESGAAALEALRAERADLLLVDMHLGDMTGIELAERLREAGLDRGARLVALSADAQPEEIETAQRAGFDGYLTKPIRPTALAEVFAAARRGRASG